MNIRIHHIAIGLGLALFAAPSILFARPMTARESECFEYSEAVYQAVTPPGWDLSETEPYPVAEYMAERAMIECLAECGEDDPGLYDWSNYVCK